MPPFFITLEGPEGSGKTTQAQLLADTLMRHGMKVKLSREPGGDPVGEDIRKILLDSPDGSIVDRTEVLLYLASRAQHTELLLRPALQSGSIVICDRYVDSTIAYQGYGSGLDLGMIHCLNDFATNSLTPNLTLLLDIDAEAGLKRQNEWNRMERKAVDYHKRVREGFLEQARLHPERIVVIDASMDLETVHRQVLGCVASRLGLIV